VTTRQQWMVIAGIVAVLSGALLIASSSLGSELFPLKVGSKAPDFAAVTMPSAGTPVRTKTLDDYSGEIVLLNIWATWCEPCRVEMPSMQRLEERLGPKGLKIVAVTVDDPGMEAKIQAFVDEYKLTFEILYDAPGAIRRQYRTTGVPETFILGRDGTIRRWIIGADNWSSEANIAFLERLLAEPATR
jgi:cytochrome c biogenesis protein CcmG, thiol:disulfide interchange protein DsbE